MPREVRHHKCIGQHHIVKDLPTVTIVMPYLNETWSQMEATLASILLYTPPELLDEILMIDDGNLEDWKFHDKLKATHPKIRVIRNEERQGLIRSKVIGAASMVSPVLVFMEPHCIVTREWLEPLLERINQHEHNIIVVPTLDIIPEHDFTQYLPANYHIGGFSWALNFMWRELITERNATYQLPEPYPTPALSGGIFAIWRDYWHASGTYDMNMSEWGGEHIEMSLRTWRCGGRIEVVPCSRIGHVFRAKNPYVVHQSTLHKNLKRVALVWLDDHIEQVYGQHSQMRYLDAGDVQERIDFFETLNCKSMDWYLDNVYPELKEELQVGT